MPQPKPPGWYLGLRYMQGQGLIARVAEKIAPQHRGGAFIFADEILCQALHWREILADWWDSLAPGGHLIVWLPDCRFQAPAPQAARLTLGDITQAFDQASGWSLRESDVIDGHAFVVWQKRDDARQLTIPWRKQPHHLLVARTGAHGDALMAASILPWLKDQNWTISFLTREAGAETLRHDPHIDEIITLAAGQVSDEEIPYYWQAWARRFDRFINLTHSVEGELLKRPGSSDYWWSEAQRRAMCGQSYLGYLHRLAAVPRPYRVAFYPSAAETAFARAKAHETGPFILWCLRGSAPHKWWPYAPQAVCQILAHTKAAIILTGDAESLPLAAEITKAVQDYYGATDRLHTLVQTGSIREAMALAHCASLVIGPETGVMNAVCLHPVPKILLLSHSSPANLSGDWIATTALMPTTDCYPCHRLHYTHDWCPQDAATGAAACAASITVEAVVEAVKRGLEAGGRGLGKSGRIPLP